MTKISCKPAIEYYSCSLNVISTSISHYQLSSFAQHRVPLGTAVKYVSSCKFDSSSTEVSSDSDLRKSMSKEAEMSESFSASASFAQSNLIQSFSASVSASSAFSQSSKFESESEQSKSERSMSFESRAICLEFEASFIPSYEQALHPQFIATRDALPVPCKHVCFEFILLCAFNCLLTFRDFLLQSLCFLPYIFPLR